MPGEWGGVNRVDGRPAPGYNDGRGRDSRSPGEDVVAEGWLSGWLHVSAGTAVWLLVGAVAALWLVAMAGQVPLRYNLRNLAVRWKTTIMTGVAFTMVTALLVVMLAFVNGMYLLTQTSGQPGNVLIFSEGTTDEIFSSLGFGDVGDIENQRGIRRDATGPLVSRETFLVINQPILTPVPGRPPRRFMQIRGIDDPQRSGFVHGIDLYENGRWFSASAAQEFELPEGGRKTVHECVIGEGIARELGFDREPQLRLAGRNPNRLDVGDVFSLREHDWIVVGVMQSSGSTFDSEIWVKRDTIAKIMSKDTLTTLVARTEDNEQAARLKTFFNQEYKKAKVTAHVEQQFYENMSQTNTQFLYSIIFVTVVMSVGGMFGVMNTMFAAVAQRTKDFGVLRLLGFASWQIVTSLLIESLAIALLGGAAGCAIGMLADGWTANSVVSAAGGGGKFVVLKMNVDQDTLAVGMLVAALMGALGGLIPALTAMRLKPLDALR